MLNTTRIRTMTRMAIYEEQEGAEDMKVNEYFMPDYLISKAAGSFVAYTIAFALYVAAYWMYHFEDILTTVYSGSMNKVIAEFLRRYTRYLIPYLILTVAVYAVRYLVTERKLSRYRSMIRSLEDSYEEDEA